MKKSLFCKDFSGTYLRCYENFISEST